jgi:adenylate cyclase
LVRARSAREPAIILLDDLQWIDPGSEFFLDHFFEAIEGTRTMILLNFRPGYEAGWMLKPWYQQVRLGPLDEDAMRELVRDLLGDDPSVSDVIDSVITRSEGIPFFAEEIVRCLLRNGHLEGTRGTARLAHPFTETPCCLAAPQSLESMIIARIGELPARERRLLEQAAVIGKQFARPVLEAVSGLSAEEITESLHRLRQLELIMEESLYPLALFAFAHPLLQEVAYSSQLKENRTCLHALVARAMADQHTEEPQEDSALVAFHWEEGGATAEAMRWHARAAGWAGSTRAMDALRHWRRAYELLEGVADPDEVSDVAIDVCYGILNLGWRIGLGRDEATKVLAAGSALAERLGDVGKLALLKSAFGSICGVSGDTKDFLAFCQQAARLADRSGDADVDIAVTWRLVYALLLAGKLGEALEVTERALENCKGDMQLGASLVLTSPLAGLVIFRTMLLCFTGRLEEAEQAQDRMLAIAREVNRYEALCLALSVAPYLAWARGGQSSAVEQARQALALSENLESPFFRHAALQSVGLSYLLEGQVPEALQALRRARDVAAASGTGLDVEGWALAVLAQAELAAGEVQQGLGTARASVASTRRHGTRLYEIDAQLALARARLRVGGAGAEVEDALDRAQELIDECGARLYVPFLCVQRAALAQARGDELARRRELEEARRRFVEIGAPARVAWIAKQLETTAA